MLNALLGVGGLDHPQSSAQDLREEKQGLDWNVCRSSYGELSGEVNGIWKSRHMTGEATAGTAQGWEDLEPPRA